MLYLYDVQFNRVEFRFVYRLVARVPARDRRSYERLGFVATGIDLLRVLRGVEQ